MSRLSDKLQSGQQVFTAEITPPKGAGIKKLLRHAELLSPVVDAINITDCQRALVRMSSLAACKVLLDNGHEPVYQLTCRDRNTIGLQSDLMGAGALGIPNLLCLTGDPVKAGDHPNAKSVFEVEAVGLLKLVGNLQKSHDQQGHKMNKATQFFIGAVVNPTLQNEKSQLIRMEKKLEAGAQFFQTQANYDLDDLGAFLEDTKRLSTKVLTGVLVLHSYEMALYIHEEIPGIRVPENVLDRLKTAKDCTQTGIDFAVETMLKMQGLCDGFHLMSIRAEELIPKILEAYHARRKTGQNTAAPMPSPTRG